MCTWSLWSGFDPESGEPWEDSWVPRAFLSADLRRGGLLREARRCRGDSEEGGVGGLLGEDVQRRKSPRVAGLAPGPGLGGVLGTVLTTSQNHAVYRNLRGMVPGCRVWCRVAVSTGTGRCGRPVTLCTMLCTCPRERVDGAPTMKYFVIVCGT